ncbi:calcium/sodium antiporter [Roseospira goensis]|uniref:Cation:H+ antiporter n=1 Tax=Roseospira goensis TaxID=391922 RepID=A0A7W6RZM7_9PROT|nr:calcium/sodium antiporter [Roseospira goensis]MBB4285507.1 cation:H+ antiporter [Roseospira goensis]
MSLAMLLIGGVVCLVVGGESLVRGAVAVARHMGVSPLLIGLTLVGFGTSTPELVTSLQAAAAGSPGVAVGNVIGSNIANILLILGVAALVRPVMASPAAFRRDGPMVVLAALAALAVVVIGEVGRAVGAALVAVLVVYVVATYLLERRAAAADAGAVMHAAEADAALAPPAGLAGAIGYLVGGLALTVLGARLLVDGAIGLAADLGVSDTLVGLTLVAVGTSLPELVTSVIAALRGQSDVAFGNIIGSNIVNILGILGLTAVVVPIPIPPEVAAVDIWVMLAATGALLAAVVSGWRVTRLEGAVLLAGYAIYLLRFAVV